MTNRKTKAKAKTLARFPPQRTQNVRRGPRLNARYPTLPVRGSSEKQIPFGDDNKKGKDRRKGKGKDRIPLSGAEEFVGGDGVGADADAGGVVDGVGDGGWHA